MLEGMDDLVMGRLSVDDGEHLKIAQLAVFINCQFLDEVAGRMMKSTLVSGYSNVSVHNVLPSR